MDECIELAVKEIRENTAVCRETLFINDFRDASNTSEYMSKKTDRGYIVFQRNEKGRYSMTNSSYNL